MSTDLTLKRIQEIEEVERLQKKKKEKKLNRIGDFYSELSIFLNEMQRNYENEVKINPSSQKSIMLREQIIRAKELGKNIYDMREETVVHYALSFVKGIPPKDIDSMTTEEKGLYNSLIETFDTAKKEVFKERAVREEIKKVVVEKEEIESKSLKKEISEETLEIQKPIREETMKSEIKKEIPKDEFKKVGFEEKNFEVSKEVLKEFPKEEIKNIEKSFETSKRDDFKNISRDDGKKIAVEEKVEKPIEKEISKSITENTKSEIKKLIDEKKIEIKKEISNPQEEYSIVRILDDMNFVGTDEKNYTLKKEDVISLPLQTAKILTKRGKGIILRSD